MTSPFRAAFLLLPLLLCGTPIARADRFNDAADAAGRILMPQIEYTGMDEASWTSYLSMVEEDDFNQRRLDISFMEKVSTTFEGIPGVAEMGGSFSNFSDVRKRYMKSVNFNDRQESSYVTFRKYYTDEQVKQFADLMKDLLNAGGLGLYVLQSSEQMIILDVVWVTPPGVEEAPELKALVEGGEVRDDDVPAGRLFPLGYKVQNGSQTVLVMRDPSMDLMISVEAAKRSETLHLPSPASVSRRSATPIGTIVASMLPPKQYALVTDDDSKWFAKTTKWVPADGREVAGSRYAAAVSTTVPDLRGAFLRGLNNFDSVNPRDDGRQDPDGEGRGAGSYQPANVGAHGHKQRIIKPHEAGGEPRTYGVRRPKHREFPAFRDFMEDDSSPRDLAKVNPIGEPRPANTGIYYYIRVN